MSAVTDNFNVTNQSTLFQERTPPASFICPITIKFMQDPVIDRHGHSYEKAAIEEWLKNHNTCPLNNKTMTFDDLVPNHALKETIEKQFSKRVPIIDKKKYPLS